MCIRKKILFIENIGTRSLSDKLHLIDYAEPRFNQASQYYVALSDDASSLLRHTNEKNLYTDIGYVLS